MLSTFVSAISMAASLLLWLPTDYPGGTPPYLSLPTDSMIQSDSLYIFQTPLQLNEQAHSFCHDEG